MLRVIAIRKEAIGKATCQEGKFYFYQIESTLSEIPILNNSVNICRTTVVILCELSTPSTTLGYFLQLKSHTPYSAHRSNGQFNLATVKSINNPDDNLTRRYWVQNTKVADSPQLQSLVKFLRLLHPFSSPQWVHYHCFSPGSSTARNNQQPPPCYNQIYWLCKLVVIYHCHTGPLFYTTTRRDWLDKCWYFALNCAFCAPMLCVDSWLTGRR